MNKEADYNDELNKYIYDNCIISSKIENIIVEVEKGNLLDTFNKLINAFQKNIDDAINDKKIQIIL